MTLFVIIYGLKTCTDCDEIKGYKKTEQEAKDYCTKMNATNASPGWEYYYELIDEL